MIRFVLLIVCLMSVVMLAGCAATMPGGGGVFPGVLVNSMTVPGTLTSDVVYQAYPDSFVVIGVVQGSSNSSNVLGLFSFGDGGYRKAIDAAKEAVGADGLINCVGDVKSSSFLFLFSSSKTVVRGLAIKRK